ncbi:MAG: hypothetical protein HYZ51_00250 [Candidatus Doudnabacteria bacterium]|nr:hypothetical protein [Candidatus Doudnabacteria bacterium]
MPNQDIDAFIAQKRAEKQSDEIILEELVSIGWEKTSVLRKLAGGGTAPSPDPSGQATSSVGTNQTGGTGTPVQLENVQYNVQVGKVRSKIGFAAFLMAILVWLAAGVLLFLLLTLRAKILPSVGDELTDLAGQIVLSIAFLVPLVPALWYTRRRLHKILAENPASADDLFFKRTIRFHLVIGVLVALLWIAIAVYNILAKVFLDNADITSGATEDSVIFALIFGSVAMFLLHYQNMTKR